MSKSDDNSKNSKKDTPAGNTRSRKRKRDDSNDSKDNNDKKGDKNEDNNNIEFKVIRNEKKIESDHSDSSDSSDSSDTSDSENESVDLESTDSDDSDYDPKEDEYDYEDGFLVMGKGIENDDEIKKFAKFLGKRLFEAINQKLEDDEEEDDDDEEDDDEDDEEKKLDKALRKEDQKIKKEDKKNKKKDKKYSVNLNIPEKKYFKKLPEEEKKLIEKNNLEVINYSKNDIPLKIKILKASMPISSKSTILSKIVQFQTMNPMESEFNKMRKYMEGLDRLPFGNYIEMPIKKSDSYKKINSYIKQSYKYLDDSVYGQKETKFKILQILAQWISNPKSKGSVIALQGPPGIGKTTILKNGLAKALGRPFSFITLGGATDSSFLEGHSYTYEGASYGRIAGILMETKCMNPIIFFDELDKVSETKHGEEIIGILTHLTDSSQNSDFHDKYFAGIDLDLSRALIVFSYNDPEKINPILKDRILTIKVKGFETPDKIKIARDYLMKEISENIGLKKDDIIFSEEVLKYIIDKYTNEKGVRELKRCLETIVLKLNLMRYTDMKFDFRLDNIDFPVTLTKENVDKIIGSKDKDPNQEIWQRMYL